MEDSTLRIDTLQAIELAEGVEVRLRIAGPLPRGIAMAIDLIIQMLILIAGAFVLVFAGVAIGFQVAMGIFLLVWFFMRWWYPVFFEASKRGATPGKRMMGLRVVQTSGAPITFGQSILRNFLRWIDEMPLWPTVWTSGLPVPTMAFGLAACMATKRFQRLGDLAAGTVVIYDRVLPEPSAPAPPPMEAARPAMALRPEEVRAVVAFRERAGFWSEGRQVEIANHAKELTGADGRRGVTRIMAIAHWLQERR
ncbi:RDD family protein [Luteolibacter flavescens]|uniref:RDD family protein n=1 Tax=Luteolibacter flavescens TaxID=1859460 RepID=A0ABT3FSJ0_9BACT|nr:RDD family protein [Luteolibacter flavescens]MCW1886274.1 RDD family protein [Luteolibacter flavescens]